MIHQICRATIDQHGVVTHFWHSLASGLSRSMLEERCFCQVVLSQIRSARTTLLRIASMLHAILAYLSLSSLGLIDSRRSLQALCSVMGVMSGPGGRAEHTPTKPYNHKMLMAPTVASLAIWIGSSRYGTR